jgi:hypothetical protein
MDEHVSLDTIARIHGNEEVVPVMLRYWDILMIFETSTMTLTHPNITDDAKRYYTELAMQLELRLAEEFPELRPLLKMCWNRQLPLTHDPNTIQKRQDWVNTMSTRYRRKTGRK